MNQDQQLTQLTQVLDLCWWI